MFVVVVVVVVRKGIFRDTYERRTWLDVWYIDGTQLGPFLSEFPLISFPSLFSRGNKTDDGRWWVRKRETKKGSITEHRVEARTRYMPWLSIISTIIIVISTNWLRKKKNHQHNKARNPSPIRWWHHQSHEWITMRHHHDQARISKKTSGDDLSCFLNENTEQFQAKAPWVSLSIFGMMIVSSPR